MFENDSFPDNIFWISRTILMKNTYNFLYQYNFKNNYTFWVDETDMVMEF